MTLQEDVNKNSQEISAINEWKEEARNKFTHLQERISSLHESYHAMFGQNSVENIKINNKLDKLCESIDGVKTTIHDVKNDVKNIKEHKKFWENATKLGKLTTPGKLIVTIVTAIIIGLYTYHTDQVEKSSKEQIMISNKHISELHEEILKLSKNMKTNN